MATVPSWREAGLANWPGIVAVLVAVAFGAWGLDLFPGETTPPNVGLPAVEAWLLAGVIYAGLAVLVGRGDRSGTVLGFSRATESVDSATNRLGDAADDRTSP
jgi:hypothetical protein